MEDLSDLKQKMERLYIMVSRFAKEERSVLKRLDEIERKITSREAMNVDFGKPQYLINKKLKNINGGGVRYSYVNY